MIKIIKAEYCLPEIPFRFSFAHASAVRKKTQTLWIRLYSGKGNSGMGESCPREYVTGETPVGCVSELQRQMRNFCVKVNDVKSLLDWILKNKKWIDNNPAAFCALEIAFLDLLGKELKKDAGEIYILIHKNLIFKETAIIQNQKIKGTAVLGKMSFGYLYTLSLLYKVLGFKDFKYKLSGNYNLDKKVLRLFSKKMYTVRIDANNYWKDPDEAADYMNEIGSVFAAEEPVSASDWKSLHKFYHKTKIPVILDESIKNTDDFKKLNKSECQWILNVRISKMGGLIRSLVFSMNANQKGFQIVLGSHVGETSLLAATEKILYEFSGIDFLFYEGAFSNFLLEYDPFVPKIRMGFGGTVRNRLSGAGMGVKFEKGMENKFNWFQFDI